MSKQFILMLEGPDDANMLLHFMRFHKFPICPKGMVEDEKVQIIDKNGVESVLDSLKIILRIQDTERAEDRIGIVVDADADSHEEDPNTLEPNAGLVRRWQSLRDILLANGYTSVPEIPDPTGTIIGQELSDKPTIGLWLMPNNQVPGKLENFVHFLLPSDDTLWPRAISAVQAIPIEERKFKSKDVIKAQVHTWLAWQKDPGKPIGLAISMEFLKAESLHATALLGWLQRLFS